MYLVKFRVIMPTLEFKTIQAFLKNMYNGY